jgi:hypothetical protein
MSKGGSTVEETPQQVALAQYASDQMFDYEKRWLPVQKNLIAQAQDMGKADSAVRNRAEGRVAADSTAQFGAAEGALEKTLANNGVMGSSRSKLAITGLGDDAAKSKGLGITMADQQVDDAYTQALGALAAELSQADLAAIQAAIPEDAAAGDRYNAHQMAALDSERG